MGTEKTVQQPQELSSSPVARVDGSAETIHLHGSPSRLLDGSAGIEETVQQPQERSSSPVARLDRSPPRSPLHRSVSQTLHGSTGTICLRRSPSRTLDGSTRTEETVQQPPERSSSPITRLDGSPGRDPLHRSVSQGLDGNTRKVRFRRSQSLIICGSTETGETVQQLPERSSSPVTRRNGSTGRIRLRRSPSRTLYGETGSPLSRSPSRARVEAIIDRESRNTDEYTSLSSLIKYTRSDRMYAERPPFKDNIVEKACTMYLRPSEVPGREDGCSCGFWHFFCRILSYIFPTAASNVELVLD